MILIALLSHLAGATPGGPEATLQWMEPTCADPALAAAAQSRARSICGGTAVTGMTVQYRASAAVAGCEVWLHAWCEAGPPVTYEAPGAVTAPTVYPDRGHAGTALVLTPGKHDLRAIPFPAGGTWNDRVSSARVPAGWTLRLCHEPEGVGRCSDLTADIDELALSYVGGDDAAWAEVARGPLAAMYSCPRVFENDSFKGKMLEVCSDVTDLRGGDWNDKVSSVLVPPGWTLQLCANAEYGAPCKDVEGDMAKLGGTVVGGDTTTSMRITRKP